MNLPSTIPTHFWRQAPWRLLAFVGIALLMGGLVTLAPALRESYGLLAVLVAGLGFASLTVIDHLSQKAGKTGAPVEEYFATQSRMHPRFTLPQEAKSISGSMVSSHTLRTFDRRNSLSRFHWRSSQTRIRFLLETLETCTAPEYRPKVKTLIGEIRESWDLCFVQHGRSVRSALHTRLKPASYNLLLWESDAVVGALLEETFEDLGFRVLRMPTHRLWAFQEQFLDQGPAFEESAHFYVGILRGVSTAGADAFLELRRPDLLPLEKLSSSQLLSEERLPSEQREVVLAALGRLFEKALEAARLQRRNPQHSHGR